MFSRFMYALRDLALSFYLTWLAYALTVGVGAVLVAWVMTLIVAAWDFVKNGWRSARWTLVDSWGFTKEFLALFTLRGYREARDRVRR